MFKNRESSQKPNEEFIALFREHFPHVSSSAPSQGSSISLTDALDVAMHPRHYGGDGEKVNNQMWSPTPRGGSNFFTPSFLDPTSFAFTSFANTMPGYITPTPGGTNTLFHSQAGDLHLPSFGMGLGTPLSLPTSEASLHANQTSNAGPMQGFHAHSVAPKMFQNPNPFSFYHQPQQQQQPIFAPRQFSQQPTGFEPIEKHSEEHADPMRVDVEMHEHSLVVPFQPQSFEAATTMQPQTVPQLTEYFRYHVTLNAPTAMIKHADEIPITYLNKGKAYSISIVDTAPVQLPAIPAKYRTHIRISFEDEQQRQRPAACWQLWKEGRGTNEVDHDGGKLQAVEFVDPTQVGSLDPSGRPRVELECASFDRFAVTWPLAPNTAAECSVAVRFNFLSTDFSYSKGVKGIPVRLCAKTELLQTQVPTTPDAMKSDLCYCKVKLFRDHGAERKLSNDVAHIKKTIDKLKQQIAQVESGMKDFGERKRSGSISKVPSSSRPGKVPKHKRTWSMSSASSIGNRLPAEEDLHLKLQSLQDVFTSTRPASVLYLRGEEFDDPDQHPVHLSGEPQDLTKIDSLDTSIWERQSTQTGNSSIISPTPSNQSIQSGGRRESSFQQSTPFQPLSRISSNEWRSHPQTATGDIQGHTQPIVSDVPVKVQRQASNERGILSRWIEVLGIDHSYQPPPERVVKPIACFYVQPRIVGKHPEDSYYRAVYLMQRTLKDLVNGIATKCKIEPTQVIRTIRINKKGFSILLDDESVRELPEGQDLVAEFQELHPQSSMKREWDAGPTDVEVQRRFMNT